MYSQSSWAKVPALPLRYPRRCLKVYKAILGLFRAETQLPNAFNTAWKAQPKIYINKVSGSNSSNKTSRKRALSLAFIVSYSNELMVLR